MPVTLVSFKLAVIGLLVADLGGAAHSAAQRRKSTGEPPLGTTGKTKLRGWFEALEDELLEVDIEGAGAYVLSQDAEELSATPPSRGLHLLPGFDQYVLGPGTACEQIISPRRRRKVSKAAGWISPVLVSGGRVAGVWGIAEDTVAIEVFTEEGEPADKALGVEVDRLGNLLGRELRATVTRS